MPKVEMRIVSTYMLEVPAEDEDCILENLHWAAINEEPINYPIVPVDEYREFKMWED